MKTITEIVLKKCLLPFCLLALLCNSAMAQPGTQGMGQVAPPQVEVIQRQAVLRRLAACLRDQQRKVAAHGVTTRHQHAEPPLAVDNTGRPGVAPDRRAQVGLQPAFTQRGPAVVHGAGEPVVAGGDVLVAQAARGEVAQRAELAVPAGGLLQGPVVGAGGREGHDGDAAAAALFGGRG